MIASRTGKIGSGSRRGSMFMNRSRFVKNSSRPMRTLGLACLCWPLLILLTGCGGGDATNSLESQAQAGEPDQRSSASAGQAADDSGWPRFRGPSADGSSSTARPPVQWSATEHLAWKRPLPGPGASSPIVWKDRIYLTCYSGYFVPGQSGGSLENLKRHLLAIRLADGEILWDKAIPAKLPEKERIRDHGYAANTPVADADGVYVFFGKSGVFCFSHDGKEQWRSDVGQNTHGWGTAASPILHRDLLIVNASVESESLVALNRRTGQEQWRAPGIREAWNTPLIITAPSGRQELVIAIHGKILAFAPESGKPLWSCRTDISWYMAPSLIARDGVIYCLGGRSGIASLAVRAGGSGDVTQTHRLWTTHEGSNVSSPLYYKGHLYWMNDQRGTAYCARADDGEVLYEKRLERAGQVYASPLLADGRIYYLTRNGKTFVLAADPTFKQLAVNDLNDGSLFNGSPAAVENRLLIRSDKFLYCIQP